jgi:glycolate oxidase iron-sulfur subunit
LSEAAADGLLIDGKGRPWDVEKVLTAADWLKDRVIDVNVLLMDKLGIDRLSGRFTQSVKVTYHDPCHLAKAQKIRLQPRQILRAIDGIEFKEMAEADACCGGSGTFGLSHFDLAMKILDRKISSIRETGADIVATSCPSCMTQLGYGLRKAGARMEVLHPLQLLVRSAPK